MMHDPNPFIHIMTSDDTTKLIVANTVTGVEQLVEDAGCDKTNINSALASIRKNVARLEADDELMEASSYRSRRHYMQSKREKLAFGDIVTIRNRDIDELFIDIDPNSTDGPRDPRLEISRYADTDWTGDARTDDYIKRHLNGLVNYDRFDYKLFATGIPKSLKNYLAAFDARSMRKSYLAIYVDYLDSDYVDIEEK